MKACREILASVANVAMLKQLRKKQLQRLHDSSSICPRRPTESDPVSVFCIASDLKFILSLASESLHCHAVTKEQFICSERRALQNGISKDKTKHRCSSQSFVRLSVHSTSNQTLGLHILTQRRVFPCKIRATKMNGVLHCDDRPSVQLDTCEEIRGK